MYLYIIICPIIVIKVKKAKQDDIPNLSLINKIWSFYFAIGKINRTNTAEIQLIYRAMATPLLFIISGVYTAARNPTDKKLAKICFFK